MHAAGWPSGPSPSPEVSRKPTAHTSPPLTPPNALGVGRQFATPSTAAVPVVDAVLPAEHPDVVGPSTVADRLSAGVRATLARPPLSTSRRPSGTPRASLRRRTAAAKSQTSSGPLASTWLSDPCRRSSGTAALLPLPPARAEQHVPCSAPSSSSALPIAQPSSGGHRAHVGQFRAPGTRCSARPSRTRRRGRLDRRPQSVRACPRCPSRSGTRLPARAATASVAAPLRCNGFMLPLGPFVVLARASPPPWSRAGHARSAATAALVGQTQPGQGLTDTGDPEQTPRAPLPVALTPRPSHGSAGVRLRCGRPYPTNSASRRSLSGAGSASSRTSTGAVRSGQCAARHRRRRRVPRRPGRPRPRPVRARGRS